MRGLCQSICTRRLVTSHALTLRTFRSIAHPSGVVCAAQAPGVSLELPRPLQTRGVSTAYTPNSEPVKDATIEKLADTIYNSKNVMVITGAGCSTESNIPDYRGPAGAYQSGFTPMTHQQFVNSATSRSRYWARSFAGWPRFASARPSAAHEGLARLQLRNWVGPIITQNVDRLHHAAGAKHIIELHGTTHRVTCLSCGAESSRVDMQSAMAALNPASAARLAAMTAAVDEVDADARFVADAKNPMQRPDGDVELGGSTAEFQVPSCTACGVGPLKPDVVFFGDNVPPERRDRAAALAEECDLLMVVGSSLTVFSAFRLVDAAVKRGATLAIVNVGTTRADHLAHIKVEALVGEVMMRLALHPSLLLPRPVG